MPGTQQVRGKPSRIRTKPEAWTQSDPPPPPGHPLATPAGFQPPRTSGLPLAQIRPFRSRDVRLAFGLGLAQPRTGYWRKCFSLHRLNDFSLHSFQIPLSNGLISEKIWFCRLHFFALSPRPTEW